MTEQTHGTGIEWTHVPGYKGETWNPVRGCTKISPGCKHCYAETFAERWRGVADHPYEQGFDLRLVPEKLDEPLHHKSPRAYFVNSMSDLHQPWLPDLESKYANVVAKGCRTCPHRGLPLASLPADKRGVVTCAGHGLQWNQKTGVLVREGQVVL